MFDQGVMFHFLVKNGKVEIKGSNGVELAVWHLTESHHLCAETHEDGCEQRLLFKVEYVRNRMQARMKAATPSP